MNNTEQNKQIAIDEFLNKINPHGKIYSIPDYLKFKSEQAQKEFKSILDFIAKINSVEIYTNGYQKATKTIEAYTQWIQENQLPPEIKDFVFFDDTILYDDYESAYVMFQPNKLLPCLSKYVIIKYLNELNEDSYQKYNHAITIMKALENHQDNPSYIEAKSHVEWIQENKDILQSFEIIKNKEALKEEAEKLFQPLIIT